MQSVPARSLGSSQSFDGLLRRLRSGDQAAAAEIHTHFGGHIRRLARQWLSRKKLGRLLDSEDICQSVLCDFFARYEQGSYQLSDEVQLRALLARITTSRLLYHWERHRTAKRDLRRLEEHGAHENGVREHGAHENVLGSVAVTGQPSPSEVLAGRELMEEFRRRFSADEWTIVQLRNDGESWKAISENIGRSPDTLRMQFTRAVTRVAQELYDHHD